MTNPPSQALFNKPFILLCLGSLLFFASTHVLTPVFPLYFKALNFSGETIGTLMASCIIASICIRPWVGKMADQGSKKSLMVYGLLLFSLCPMLYLISSAEWFLLLVRILHGIGFALVYTASTSAAVDMIPANRRVEGISHYSNAIKVAMAFSPPLGLWLAQQQWHQGAFVTSVIFGLLTLACMAALPSSLFKRKQEQKALLESLGAGETTPAEKPKGRLLCTQAFLPGLIMATNGLGFGALIPYIPLLASEKALANPGLFYTAYSICLIASRGLTGNLADKYGRAVILWPGMILVSLALFVLAWASQDWLFVMAAGLYGLAAGSVQPSLLAVAVDRAPKQETGSAMATFTVLNDLGTAIGQFTMAYLGTSFGYTNSLVGIAALSISGWILYGILYWQDTQTNTPSGTIQSTPA